VTRVLVCGGREFHDRKLVFDTLDCLTELRDITSIVHVQHADDLAKIAAAWKG
jgi:hypothetical protein